MPHISAQKPFLAALSICRTGLQMASIQNGSGSTFEAAEASRKKAFKPDNPKLAKRSQQELEKLKALGLANVRTN